MKKVLLQSIIFALLLAAPAFAEEQSAALTDNTVQDKNIQVETTTNVDSTENQKAPKIINLNDLFNNNSNSNVVTSPENQKQAVNSTSKKAENKDADASKINSFSRSNDEEESSELKGYLEYDSSGENGGTTEESNDEATPLYIQQAQELETSENAVGLGDSDFKKKNINIKAPPKFATKSLVSDSDKDALAKKSDNSIILDSASKFSDPEYWIGPVSTGYTATSGRFTFGTSFYSGLDSASLSSSTGVFTRYEGKHFAISTSFSKGAQYNDDSYSNTFSIAPEIKITKRLSFVDIIQTDMEQVSRKNKIVLRYCPKIKNHQDDVQLEFGAGQSFYENQYVDSSVSFSTRFKL